MLTFTSREILASLVHASLFGAVASLLSFLILLIKGVIEGGTQGMKDIIRFERLFPLPCFSEVKISGDLGPYFTVVFILLFAVGFSLLSYYSLDGAIRLYMLITAFASFYVSKFAFYGIFDKLFIWIIRLTFILFSFFLRVIIIPFRATVKGFNKLFYFSKKLRIKK